MPLMGEARSDEDARREANDVLGGEEVVDAFIGASGGVHATDDVGDGRLVVGACRDADHDDNCTSLVVDQIERGREGAGCAERCPLRSGGHQHRGVDGELGSIRIRCGADDADHGGSNGLDRTGPSVDLEDLYAVEKCRGHG